MNRSRRWSAGLAAIAALALLTPVTANATATPITSTMRLGGNNRYEVSAAISQRYHVGTADTVYVASGLVYPDALTGGAAAAKASTPLLLVGQDSIPASVSGELTRLAPQQIVPLGCPATVSTGVETSLRAIAPPPESAVPAGTKLPTIWSYRRWSSGCRKFPDGRGIRVRTEPPTPFTNNR